ncbi:MAG: DJ-1/PfpI family protein [Pseudomonadota bacterium]
MPRVVFLIYDDVEVMDFSGPFDVFSMGNIASRDEVFELRTACVGAQPITAMHGLKIVPDFDLPEISSDDVVIIPGGTSKAMDDFGAGKHPEIIAWVRDQCPKARIVATVCVGALIGALAGLFAGRCATTHHQFFDRLDEYADHKAKIMRGARFVVNEGQPIIAASAGVSAGIDLAFELLGHIVGLDLRVRTAKIMEYRDQAGLHCRA